ncbi:MAG: dATP pyrophosphohydrolase [Alphaproteobacteria bacterium]|nr:dATP pyrophosphohydrolase [Alphaproteobacteria bacterium]
MAPSDIVVSPVVTKADLKAFIDLPKRLYAGHKGYVPHLDVERREAYSPKKNPLFQHVEVQFFLARRDGRVVGRITAQIDRASLERYADSTGHFGCLVAEDDPAIFAALFAAVEAWLKSKGMVRATGPFSLSVNEEVGLLIDGFDSRPVLMVPYDPPYAGSRVEACGYAKIKDLFSYDYDVQNAPETIGAKLMARAGMAGRVKVRTANMKMFDAEVRTLVGIFNDAWSDNWGFVPFTQAEIDHASKAFGPVIVPELAVFVEVDDEAVAFIVALTNLNEAIDGFNGKLGPLSLAKLLYRLKIAGVGSTRVPLMGVKKKFRNHPLMGAGLAMMAIDHLRANGKRLGKTSAELGWILEDNKATNNIIRSVGGVHYKTHRIYEKALG